MMSVLQIVCAQVRLTRERETMSPTVRPEDLWGTWRLKSYAAHAADGSAPYFPLGRDALGFIYYSPTGHMAAQLMQRGRTSSATRWDDISAEDGQVAARGYIAYAGTYSISNHIVTHHVETSLFPHWVGTDLQRLATVSGGHLELRVAEPVRMQGAMRRPVLQWVRLYAS